jgi:carboxypeptidase PM20D1
VAHAPVSIQDAAGRLGEALRLPIVTKDGVPPDAAALRRFHEWLSLAYPALYRSAPPITVGAGTLIFRLPGSGKAGRPIVLMAHQDVVPVQTPGTWAAAPFSGELREGAVWGRGAIDNRGSLIAIIEVLNSIIEGEERLSRDVYLVSSHDEEGMQLGAKAAAAWFQEHNIRPEFVLDEGSLVISDHPVTRGSVALIGISEKGYATLRITAHATGGHSSAPPSDTAVSTLAEALRLIAADPFPLHYGGPTKEMLDALAPSVPFTRRIPIANSWLFAPVLERAIGATPQGAAMLQTTMAPTMLVGSPKANVLPTAASAWINYRIAPTGSVADVERRARNAVKGLPVTLSLVGPAREPSRVSNSRSVGFNQISSAAGRTFGVVTAPAPVIAATDSRAFEGIADDIYRFQPIELSIAETELIHGTDEHLSVHALQEMVDFYYELLRKTAFQEGEGNRLPG